MRREVYHQDWPAPLSGEQQLELFREMARAQSSMGWSRLWRAAACRAQCLEGLGAAERASRRATARYQRARNRLWETSMRLVLHCAGRYAGSSVGVEELVSLGAMRLQYAIERFDYRRGVQFSTYCVVALQRDFTRAVEQAGRRRARERSLGVVGEDLRSWESLLGGVVPGDYDQPAGDEETLGEIRRAVAALPARERRIVLARCGRETLPTIAGQLGKSKERVRQLEARAIRRVADRIGGGVPKQSLAKV